MTGQSETLAPIGNATPAERRDSVPPDTRFWLRPTILAAAAALLIVNEETGERRIGPIPAMPQQAATTEGFVPARRCLDAQASGDLDGDGVADLALVVAASEDVTAATPRPRILAVATGRPGGGYVLAAENHTFIPPQTGNDADDPNKSHPPQGRRRPQ